MSNSDVNPEDENFAAMFEESLSRLSSFKPGDLVRLPVVSVADDVVFLELGGKSEGQLDTSELIDDDGKVSVSPGDVVKVYFIKRENGIFKFTTRIQGDSAGNEVLEQAFASRIPVEGVVEEEIKGGYRIKIGDVRAFCPHSQMGLRNYSNPEVKPGMKFSFIISEFKENGRNILVSNRALLEEEYAKKMEELKAQLKPGMKISGTVVKLQNFGAFVDISGIQALLPVSEISRRRINEPSDLLKPGQEIEAVILSLDWERQRISISMKALEADPWEEAARKYKAGSVHKGKVARITKFGAFITLEPGLDGLVHESELRSSDNSGTPVKLKAGDEYEVKIISVDAERQRIALAPASSSRGAEENHKYFDTGETEGYNPFAALKKKK